ncbi:hypothetical protein [Cohnella zeiphila]|uniref:Phage tail tape measure protein n=1 Tax=Cohnella zeiphila TaxID=2761120 RepID=A0A7X0SQE8_9BACL|nr:hypothetical protein [Cohnella zeiphila]MBB6733184.1 hypothetical protein [Cohnella zeiphila]
MATVSMGLKVFDSFLSRLDSIQSISKAVDFAPWSDSIANAAFHLNLANDSTKTQLQLQQKVLAVADQTRQSYAATAQLMTRLGASGQSALKDNSPVVSEAASASPGQKMTDALNSGSQGGDGAQATAPSLPKALTEGMNAAKSFEQAITKAKDKTAEWVSQFNEASEPIRKVTDSIGQLISGLNKDQGKGLFSGLTGGIQAVSNALPMLAVMGVITLILTYLDSLGISAQQVVQGIVDFFNWAFEMIGQGISFVQGIAQGMWDAFLYALPVIAPLVIGIVAAFGAYYGILLAVSAAQAIWTGLVAAYRAVVTMATAIQLGLNMAMWANPIPFMIGLIVGLITALLALIATLQPVRDYVANTFRSLGEIIAQAAGWIIDVITGFVNGAIDAINLLLSGINKVIHAVGNFLGLSVDVDLQLEKVDSSKLKAEMQKGITGTFDAAANFTENFNVDNIKKKLGLDSLGKMGKMTDQQKPPALPKNPYEDIKLPGTPLSDINKVNEVGKINDSVDVSSEDLKTMRELAEMKNIQNFVTLQPSLSFGDTHVRQDGRSVDEIIANISDRLHEQIASSAQGVYG